MGRAPSWVVQLIGDVEVMAPIPIRTQTNQVFVSGILAVVALPWSVPGVMVCFPPEQR